MGLLIESLQGFNSKQEIAEEGKAPGGPGLKLTDATSYRPKQDTGQLEAREGRSRNYHGKGYGYRESVIRAISVINLAQ